MALSLLKNRYQILQVMGTGGFGKTFLAEDTQMPSSKKCVIKQLIPITHNPQVYQLVQQRFQQEAATLEELGDHNPQIPRLYAYFSEDNEFYLVQEYVEGQTLTEKVSQVGVLSETEVKEILSHILLILEYVHGKGIVHRDIKPDNIILRSTDSKPVLIDFGAVKVTMNTVSSASGNTKSIVIGTPGFMPMEQIVGRPIFASDLFSLGLTAIYLLTGKVPQDLPTEPTTGNVLWRNFVPSLTVEFGDVLDKAIAYHSGDRYPTARDMLTALQTSTISSTKTPQSSPTLITAQPSVANLQQETVITSPKEQLDTPLQYPVKPTRSLRTWQKVIKVIIICGAIGLSLVGGLAIIVIGIAVTHQSPRTLTTRPGPIRSIAISPDGKTIVSGDDGNNNHDGTVKFWDLNTGTLLNTLLGHSNWVQSVAFSPDGKTIASGSVDGTIRLWDLTGKSLSTFQNSRGIYSLAFSHDGKVIVSGDGDGIIKFWDLYGKSTRIIKAHSGSVISIVISPDGNTLVSRDFSHSFNKEDDIKIWNLSTGKLIRTINGGVTGGVNSLAISPNGNILAGYFGEDKKEAVRLWSLKTGEIVGTLDVQIERPHAVAFSPNGKTVAVGGFSNQIQIWNLSTQQKLSTFTSDNSGSQTYSLAFSNDGKTLVNAGISGNKEFIKIWKINPNIP